MSHRYPTLQLAGLFLLITVTVAEAKTPIAVLPFGGDAGPTARATLVSTLGRRYQVVNGQAILDACDELGITMTRGKNLVRAAARAQVVGVIGGAVSGGFLSLAVYSGKNGDVVSSGRIRTGGRLNKKALRAALTVILKGLRQCPARPAKTRRPRPAPTPEPAPTPAPAPAPTKAPSLVFDPDPVISGGGTATPGAGTSTTGAGAEPDENPLAEAEGPTLSPIAVQPAPTPTTVTRKPRADRDPRVDGTLGFGIWKRTLQIHDHLDRSGSKPNYDSGVAAALSLGFHVRPIAFFTDGFAANFYSRLSFQTMLGLQSRYVSNNVEEMHGTTMWELRWELAGYDWNILDKPTSPHLEGGIGFGLMNFSIDWGDSTDQPMPAASYTYFLLSVGSSMPFFAMMGAHFRFDYRVVSGAGEIEDDTWYGPSSTGGISLLLGINGNYKGFVARVEYEYTRYFYAFQEGDDRMNACPDGATGCKRAAGGALDVSHAMMFNVGYSY